MNFLVRFILGLPARQVDFEEMKEVVPELLSTENIFPEFEVERYLLLIDLNNTQTRAELAKWIQQSEISLKENTVISQDSCPSPNCPIKGYSESIDGVVGSNNSYIHLQRVGGGPKIKPPLSSFLDLVRKTHAGTRLVKEVILTDPYIYSNSSVEGIAGGFENLIAYLGELKLDRSSTFTIKMNPSPLKATEKAKNVLRKKIGKKFPNASIGNYSPKYDFHDRFYIARDDKGELQGVFGPSLNGLSSNAIVLMGDLQEQKILKQFSDWL